MKPREETMLIDAVDARNRRTGVILPRARVFERGVGFRVVHVLLFNPAGDLLLQRLAAGRKRHPGRWGSSVAAYLAAGEAYREAATRRVREELGIDATGLRWIGMFLMTDEGCRKFIGVYVGQCVGKIEPDPTHIAAIRFLPVATLRTKIRVDTHQFTPTFREVLAYYERRARNGS